MIYLLHGPDDLIRAEQLTALRAALGPPEVSDLSTTWLDGSKTPVAEVRFHCDVMPFLTPRRLVIVEGLLAYLKSRLQAGKKARREGPAAGSPSAAEQAREELLAYLPTLPATADLVLVEGQKVAGNDRILRRLQEMVTQGEAEIVACEAPAQSDLPDWIIHRAGTQKGAEIERGAAVDLSMCVGRNLRLLDNELNKLVAYRGGQGPVRRRDVRLLVPYAQEANIFDMVDAIGRQDGATALRLLRELQRDGAAPLYLLAMIVRQFRILVQVSDQMALGLDKNAIAKAIGLHPFPTQKAMQQSRQWRLEELYAAYDQLLEADLAVKTGKLADDLALDLLLVSLSERGR